MEDTDKARNEVLGFIEVVKHAQDDAAYSREETIEEGTVLEEEMAQVFIDCEDTVAMITADELEGHVSRAGKAVFIAACWTKAGMATEGDKFKLTTKRASIHGTAKGGIPTMNHLVYILDDGITRV